MKDPIQLVNEYFIALEESQRACALNRVDTITRRILDTQGIELRHYTDTDGELQLIEDDESLFLSIAGVVEKFLKETRFYQ